MAARPTGEFMAGGLTRGFTDPSVIDATLEVFGSSDEPGASWTIARHWATVQAQRQLVFPVA